MIEYKDSGIEWLGTIPAHWEVKRLKDVTTLNPNYVGGNCVGDVSFVPMESLRLGQIDYQDISFDEAKGKYTFFANEDLLIAKVTPCFENGNIAIAKNLKQGIGFGSSEIFVLRCFDISNNYMFYYSLSSQFQGQACATMCGVGGLKRISPLFMRTYKFAVPPLAEQQAIADYLDKKTAEIDTQVSLIDKKVTALQKLKQSLISSVVTKGLTPNVELRDSGIEWLGTIPAHWEVKRIKDVCNVVCGATPKDNTLYWDGDINWVSPADMPEFGEILEGSRTLTELGYQSCGTSLVPAGSIVMSTRAPIGKTNIALNELCTNQGCKCLTSKKIIMRFMLYSIWNKKEQFQALGRGTTFFELSTKDLSLFHLAIPPLAEQQAIADYLDKKTAEIDTQIDVLNKKATTYKKLKQSLIDEVVTGKRKI